MRSRHRAPHRSTVNLLCHGTMPSCKAEHGDAWGAGEGGGAPISKLSIMTISTRRRAAAADHLSQSAADVQRRDMPRGGPCNGILRRRCWRAA